MPDSLKHPYRDFLLNTANVYAILNAIHTHNKACKFINLSSAAVYGNPQILPVVESAQVAPMSPYGRHKVMAEAICREFAEEFGVPTCSLRIFSAFGNGLRKQIFWDMNRKMTGATEATFFGTGEEGGDRSGGGRTADGTDTARSAFALLSDLAADDPRCCEFVCSPKRLSRANRL